MENNIDILHDSTAVPTNALIRTKKSIWNCHHHSCRCKHRLNPDRSSRAAFQGLLASMSPSENVRSLGTPTEEQVDAQVDHQPPVVTSESITCSNESLRLHRETTPFNVFEENGVLFYSSFPLLFNFDRGLPSSGSVSNSFAQMTQHILFCLFAPTRFQHPFSSFCIDNSFLPLKK